jgi:hypothetical protein
MPDSEIQGFQFEAISRYQLTDAERRLLAKRSRQSSE